VSPSAPGTRPEGITEGTGEERAAAQYVRDLFSAIAGRYDFLNHLLSFQMDRYWRLVVAKRFQHILARPDARVLDLCCGTSDLTLTLAKRSRAPIIGSDFSHPMLTRAREKLLRHPLPPLLAEADALQLPFPDGTFDLVVCSFGFRNLANYRAGLREIRRVLRPGGEVGILEITAPQGWMRRLFSFYFHRIVPRIGEWVSGIRGPYRYLPRSVERFPEEKELLDWMREEAFINSRARPLTGGIVRLFSGGRS
jgi:demethylmenaquinone methyltransferase/2-methoxy-6-polyprenyl-1,4-benzoquinol methylase